LEYVYLGELDKGGVGLYNTRRLTLDDRDDWPTGWNRDSRSVYFLSTRQGTTDIFKQAADDRTAEAVIDGPGEESNAVLSPDGSMLLYESRPIGSAPGVERLMRVPIAGGPSEIIEELKGVVYFLCPAIATASCVLAQNEDGKTSFYAVDPMKGRGRKIGGSLSVVEGWNLSADGSRIAYIDHSVIRIVTVADGATENLRAKEIGLPKDVAWSAEGDALFVASLVPTGWHLLRVDFDGHVNLLRQTEGLRTMSYLIPSPDGHYLAFSERTVDKNAWILENF
jgi:Tol biopolymer transport system component